MSLPGGVPPLLTAVDDARSFRMYGAAKYLDTIFCIKFARYLVRSILLLNAFTPDAL
jgi:hypothetical protein